MRKNFIFIFILLCKLSFAQDTSKPTKVVYIQTKLDAVNNKKDGIVSQLNENDFSRLPLGYLAPGLDTYLCIDSASVDEAYSEAAKTYRLSVVALIKLPGSSRFLAIAGRDIEYEVGKGFKNKFKLELVNELLDIDFGGSDKVKLDIKGENYVQFDCKI